MTMNTNPSKPGDEKQLRVRRGRVDSVDLYEIKDTELSQFEHGSPGDLYLNFAIFLLSLAFSAFSALCTATFTNPTTKTTFIVVVVVGVLVGVFLLLLWNRHRGSLRGLCKTVRGRIPPDDASATADGESGGGSSSPKSGVPFEPVG